jgi:hypothetical protein
MTTLPATVADPFASVLRYVTEPYSQGAATQALALDPAVAGVSTVQGYDFTVFQTRYGVSMTDRELSYILTLRAELGDGPVTLEIDYLSDAGPGTAQMRVPAGTLPGASFVVPLPRDAGPILLQRLRERPAPVPGQPAGPDKWALTALLGNMARLLWLLTAERQTLAATADDVGAQYHLLTARGASLDHIGAALRVPRLLPAPYRLDLDTGTLALYHLDDRVAPVLDATHDYPGVNHGATRGVPGRFSGAAAIATQGGITIPDAAAFAIDADASFTVEMFVRLRPLMPHQQVVLAVKRPYFDRSDASGWLLRMTGEQEGLARLTFTLTDRAGIIVVVNTPDPVRVPEDWFHVAGVVDRDAEEARIYFNGAVTASVPLGKLDAIANCADIGLGADRTGVAHMAGALDEVRFSRVARTDFSSVLGDNAEPYEVDADTIALYHLDETDDWIDEDRGIHYAINHGATRGITARFDLGLRFLGDPLPQPRCAAEREFQRRLRTGQWDRTGGGASIRAGPYMRYGYRQGAISLPGLTGEQQPVMVNDDPAVDVRARGLVTTACYGFPPDDLAQTIQTLQAAGRTVQEAIDYYGDWHGEPEAWFTQQYQANQITVAHESCLPTPPTPAYVQIPGAPDLALDATTSFTVEAIVKPDALDDDYPRAIAASRSSGLREGEPNANEAGWALAVGGYNCIANNLRWIVGDATGKLVTVTAGFNLADGLFHHVAGVLDRDAEVALLFVDGAKVGQAPLNGLGAAATAGDVILGNDPARDAPYAGILDEVRLSLVARRSFHPVLGESDDRYRQRLAIYCPWRLPTITTVQRGVRALSLPGATALDTAPEATRLLLSAGPLPDVGQLDARETDSTRFCATRRFRVVPATLAPGQSIAADGTTPADEATAVGAIPIRPQNMMSEVLLRHEDTPGLVFPSEAGRWMVLSAARALEALAARLLIVAPTAQIAVQLAWDPHSNDALHAQGRALDLTLVPHGAPVDLGLLGALAHAIGIAYVRYAFNAAGPSFLRVTAGPGPDLDLAGPDVASFGQAVTLTVFRPALANPAALIWRVFRCGPGNGTLTPVPGKDNTTIQFTGTALGAVTIQVSYPLADGTFLYGARSITVAPQTLDGCEVLSGDGRENVSEAAASGAPDSDFREEYLVRSDDPRLDYTSDAARLMQLPLEIALLRLADLAAAEPGAPRITVLAAYDPGAATLQSVGRGLVVAPSTANLTAGRLGALAFRAGFSYIERRRYPPSVYLSVPMGERFQIVPGPIERLWPNARISGRGEFQATEFAAAGPPDPNFNGGWVHPYTGAGVTFVAGVSNAMQPTLATALGALVAALQHDQIAGDLQVIAGFDPRATDLTGVGRGLLMRHPAVSADRLAGYALQAGFGFVQHRANIQGGPAVYAAAYAAGNQPRNIFTDDDVVLNALTEVHVRPALPLAGQLEWCLTRCCPAAATLSTALPDPAAPPGNTRKIFRGTATGVVHITASFSLRDAAEPYQFLLVPRGEAEPRLTKDQYDDLLNFLAAYHPLGVEGITRHIRRYVHGFQRPPRWDNLPTGATYPPYRLNR